MFENVLAFDSDISGWDVSSVQNMLGMFYRSSLFNNDISSWDVSAVTTMRNLFIYANQFGQKLCEWNIGEDTDVRDMFVATQCTVVICVECPTSSPSTSSPTTDPSSFPSSFPTSTPAPTTPCQGISLLLSDSNKKTILSENSSDETVVGCFDTSEVTNMDYFLSEERTSRDTFNADLSSWDVSSVTSMQVSCC